EELKEFVVLSYRNSAKLYVPIDRLGLIQKYSGAGGTAPKIDRLGGVSWEKTKRRIKKSMRDLAEDLLKLYARREMEKGYAFSTDDSLSKEFEEAFEYEETPDQLAAIQNVKQDMEQERPMDRLICGDVGYGKTEVAMRAAFKAVNDSKQVAVLAPTTVLAFQHYNTFRERCQGFPVSIEMLSRFKSRAEQADTLRRTSLGLVDVLIGTHRLLSKDVHFKDLGLIVVDEEQRFGVAQKERLKQLRTKVDVLALSATPIPRSLNMSLIGLRDLSIIETPPRDRLAIQTVVVKFSRSIIRSAIDLELKREGQVFFVHNSVETIYSIATMIQEIMPEARVAVAHGQMREGQLQKVMIDFLNYRYDVLVATTIIENGLDISRANTLIVDRSDRFGLAQLYQLRGRVGRSSRRAYAYLMIPSQDFLSQDASKRLAAIKEFSELGSGFRIAAMDLEIRGAGNLLGSDQHGHMDVVGFELYTKLLEQTIRELRGEEVREEVQTNIDLRMDIQIPEHYIDDSNLRLWLYKRVSSAPDPSALESLKEEVVDRFGKYPNSVSNLFGYASLRLRAEQLKILSLERKGSRVFLKLREDTPISREHVIDLVSRNGRLGLTPEGTMSAEISSTLPDEVFQNIHALLDEVAVLE
ncbi:MAG: transcription-repair coupling factor, partial [Acidobacteria bacterium]|nr:transcription-repair coupling factor [Acidobacteriota bacterium]